jgi:hypothetical protein
VPADDPGRLAQPFVLVSRGQTSIKERGRAPAALFPWQGIQLVQQAIERRQSVLRQKQFLLPRHAAFAAEPQHRELILEVPGPAVPTVVDVSISRERGVQPGDPRVPPFFKPGDQLLALADAQPTEIDDAESCAAPLPQPRHSCQCLDIVIEGRSDKDPDFQIGPLRLPPVMKPVHELLETGKRQTASLARFRDQAIAADMRARRMPLRKP